MNNIINQIKLMFQNDKISEIFRNCEGSLGMINIEIEKSLTFKDVFQIMNDLDKKKIFDFIEKK